MPYGWSTKKGVRVFCQGDQQALCGPSCVAMAIQWVKKDEIDAKTISSTGAQKGMALKFNPANINNPAMKKAMPDTETDYGSLAGMGPEEVEASLIDYSIATTHTYPQAAVFAYKELRDILNLATASTPVIVQLENPSHFVICRSRAHGRFFGGGKNRYTFADPADGLIHTGAHVTGNKLIFAQYNTSVTSTIRVTGTLTHSRVKVM